MLLDQKDSHSWTIYTSCSTDTVDVVVGVLGWVHLQNVIDPIEIYPTRYHIRGEQATSFVLSERFDNFCPTIVLQFAMNTKN